MDISDLAGLHREVEEITADLDVWAGRQEPDSRARRYGSAAVSAIDAALAELQQIRARLVAELGDADKAVMADTQPPAEIMQAFRESRRGVASCGHPANEDGECDCSSWPERAPMPERPASPAPRTALDSRGVTRYGWMEPFREDTATGRPADCSCTPVNGKHGEGCAWAPDGWSTPPALDGYGYVLPEDYLRGGAQ